LSTGPSLGGSELFYRFIRVVLYITYRLLFRFRFFGSEKVPQKKDPPGVILAPNHASYLDPPVLGISLKRRVTYLAKQYLFEHGFVGWVLRNIGAYPIKSESSNDFRSIRDLIRILKQGACVVVFPEGTRSEDGGLKEPEGGIGFLAVKSGAWVVPVYIKGSYEAFPKGAKKIKRRPISAHYGEPFLPSEKGWTDGPEHYQSVGRYIMAQIKVLKETA
jgi:1-acyl-sn-glycerol-3-phosphate acyltransferase